jgi:hypothetical protein
MDKLHSRQITGTSTDDKRFNSHVGTGSSGHDFGGAVFSSFTISSSVAGSKDDSGGMSRVVSTGTGALTVDDRIICTLLRNKAAKSSAVRLDAELCSGCSTGVHSVGPESREFHAQQTTLQLELCGP